MNTRLNHADSPEYGTPCSDTRARLYLKETTKGTAWFCHNCGKGGFKPKGNLTPKELLSYIKGLSVIPKQSASQREVKLPYDFTQSIPKKGLQWFYKYGIFQEDIKKFHFGYSQKYNRVILPVFDDEELIYYQARTLDPPSKNNPKYINVRQSGAKNVWFKNFSQTKKDKLVVVEDILSAVKVGKVTNAVSLLGSYIPTSFTTLCNDFDKIYLWLDRDKLKESIAYAKKLRLYSGKLVSVVVRDKDPKEHNISEIEEILNG